MCVCARESVRNKINKANVNHLHIPSILISESVEPAIHNVKTEFAQSQHAEYTI
jgi:hypothetical protein